MSLKSKPVNKPEADKEAGLEQDIEGISRQHFISSLGALLLARCGNGGDLPPVTSVGGTSATPAAPAPAVMPAAPACPGAVPVTITTPETLITPETSPEPTTTPTSAAFAHPCLPHTQADFDRMSQNRRTAGQRRDLGGGQGCIT
ncbi:hypothetical protein CFter6_3347 [Collimonas fungivorans]|uniref:Uncharacterized protein n=1 Tax=Collimonas fungivorans TaxID=158899 RepID=A0A127PEY0_9BURK|nr:hypothetical protein CFter6_3347 [Collimonas fungivorans]